MELLYIAIGVMVVVLFIKLIIEPNIRNKKVLQMLMQIDGFFVNQYKDKIYDFTLENQDLLILIKILPIPKNSCVTINSRLTWKLSWGGSSQNKGRVYPKNRYLNEIIPFLKHKETLDKQTLKVIILYPDTEQILRYLNECELEVITSKKLPYGYKVVPFKSFVQEFPEIINIK